MYFSYLGWVVFLLCQMCVSCHVVLCCVLFVRAATYTLTHAHTRTHHMLSHARTGTMRARAQTHVYNCVRARAGLRIELSWNQQANADQEQGSEKGSETSQLTAATQGEARRQPTTSM